MEGAEHHTLSDRLPPPATRSLSIAAAVFLGLSIVFLALALLVAITLPYHDFDAMSLGTWSRLIAEHWPRLHYPEAYFGDYQRPLFYFLQGTVWSVFGFHQALGRVLSLAFAVLLLASAAWLASRTNAAYRWFAATLAVVVLLLLTLFDQYIDSGLTDIPVAAMVTVTAVALCVRRLGRTQLPVIAVASALAVLTKPSALIALTGLGGAVLLGGRAGIRRRATLTGAVVVGMALALVYDEVEAHYVHLSLSSFLSGYTGGSGSAYYSRLSDQLRKSVLLDGGWLGQDLRVLLFFAAAYSVLRVCRLQHRVAVLIAIPFAGVWAWLGPHLAGEHGVRVGILGIGSWTEQIALLVLFASLFFALDAPREVVPDPLRLARLLVWALPTFVFWSNGYAFETRALAPAWPPLVLLITWTLLPAFAGARQRFQSLIAIPAAAVVILGLLAAYNIDSLGLRVGASIARRACLASQTPS